VPPTRAASVRRYHRSGPNAVVENVFSMDWKSWRMSGRFVGIVAGEVEFAMASSPGVVVLALRRKLRGRGEPPNLSTDVVLMFTTEVPLYTLFVVNVCAVFVIAGLPKLTRAAERKDLDKETERSVLIGGLTVIRGGTARG